MPLMDEDGHSFVVIWMPSFSWTLDDFETLSHECIHASVMVMRMSGVKAKMFDAKTDEEVDDEPLAYRSSFMFSTCLTELIRKLNKIIKKRIKK